VGEAGPPRQRELLSAAEVARIVARMAHQIIERTAPEPVVMIGIPTRGVPLAHRLAGRIREFGGPSPAVGTLDITLYRDDLSTVGPKPLVQKSDLGVPVTDKNVILCDDVLYTGRTTRAALDALFDHGRPRRVQLLVLIDRGHRELPIEAAFIGRTVQTSDREIIEVKFREIDNAEKVLLVERADLP
jgi:pyrimidine operon attenuation protein/uracil phosphoribosyltransferase